MVIIVYISLVVINDAANEEIHEESDRGVVRDEVTIILDFVRLARVNPRFKVSFLSVIFKSLIEVAYW